MITLIVSNVPRHSSKLSILHILILTVLILTVVATLVGAAAAVRTNRHAVPQAVTGVMATALAVTVTSLPVLNLQLMG